MCGDAREREGEVGEVEGEDVGPGGDEVDFIQWVHASREGGVGRREEVSRVIDRDRCANATRGSEEGLHLCIV
jgi:hypothetical protein